MTTTPPADPAAATGDEAPEQGTAGGARASDPGRDAKPPRSELEDAAVGLGRALGGVMTQLFGTGVTGINPPADRPVISPEADDAIDRGSARLGQWLHGAGEALSHHPLDPSKAVDDASRIRQEPMPVEPGLTPLSIGLRSLAGGLFKTAEAVLDQVAPRKTKPAAEGDDAAADVEPDEAAPSTAPSTDRDAS